MNLRSACEGRFAVKKERFKLIQSKHRRASFWLIRVHLMALLQHGLAWIDKQNTDQFVNNLLVDIAQREAA